MAEFEAGVKVEIKGKVEVWAGAGVGTPPTLTPKDPDGFTWALPLWTEAKHY